MMAAAERIAVPVDVELPEKLLGDVARIAAVTKAWRETVEFTAAAFGELSTAYDESLQQARLRMRRRAEQHRQHSRAAGEIASWLEQMIGQVEEDAYALALRKAGMDRAVYLHFIGLMLARQGLTVDDGRLVLGSPACDDTCEGGC